MHCTLTFKIGHCKVHFGCDWISFWCYDSLWSIYLFIYWFIVAILQLNHFSAKHDDAGLFCNRFATSLMSLRWKNAYNAFYIRSLFLLEPSDTTVNFCWWINKQASPSSRHRNLPHHAETVLKKRRRHLCCCLFWCFPAYRASYGWGSIFSIHVKGWFATMKQIAPTFLLYHLQFKQQPCTFVSLSRLHPEAACSCVFL